MMQSLKQQVREDLNAYQHQVFARLIQLAEEGLVSHHVQEELKTNALVTAQEILSVLDSRDDYSIDINKIYIYSLFDRYKSRVEAEIDRIERNRANQDKVQSQILQSMPQVVDRKLGKISQLRKAFMSLIKSRN